jgi:hypothetical protein
MDSHNLSSQHVKNEFNSPLDIEPDSILNPGDQVDLEHAIAQVKWENTKILEKDA